MQYALPKISDLQGDAALTPYPYESIELNTKDPQNLVVTRVSSDGCFVTDVNPDEMMKGYNSLFAFNFSTPPGMRVCDRVTYLAGTVNEFFGFTESFFQVIVHDNGIEFVFKTQFEFGFENAAGNAGS